MKSSSITYLTNISDSRPGCPPDTVRASITEQFKQKQPLTHRFYHTELNQDHLLIYAKISFILTATLNIDTRTVLVVAAKHQRVVDINNHLSSTPSP